MLHNSLCSAVFCITLFAVQPVSLCVSQKILRACACMCIHLVLSNTYVHNHMHYDTNSDTHCTAKRVMQNCHGSLMLWLKRSDENVRVRTHLTMHFGILPMCLYISHRYAKVPWSLILWHFKTAETSLLNFPNAHTFDYVF